MNELGCIFRQTQTWKATTKWQGWSSNLSIVRTTNPELRSYNYAWNMKDYKN